MGDTERQKWDKLFGQKAKTEPTGPLEGQTQLREKIGEKKAGKKDGKKDDKRG